MFRLIACVFLALVASCTNPKSAPTNALALIPTNAALVAEVHDAQRMSQLWMKGPLYQSLQSIPPFDSLAGHFTAAGDVWSSQFQGTPFWLAIVRAGATTWGTMVVLADDDSAHFNALFSGQDAYKTYNDHPFYASPHLPRAWRGMQLQGHLVISTHEALLEDAAKMISSPSNLLVDKSFEKARKVAGTDAPANVYVQPVQAVEWASTFLPGWKSAFDWPSTGWVLADLKPEAEALRFSGVAFAKDSSQLQAGAFFEAGSGFEPEALRILPVQTGGAHLFSTKNPAAFFKNHATYLQQSGQGRPRQFWENANNLKVQSWAATWVGSEWGMVWLEDQEGLGKGLAYVKYHAEVEPADLPNLLGDSLAYQESGTDVYKTNRKGMLEMVFGTPFQSLPRPFYFMQDGWIFFADDLEVLKAHMRNLASEKTLFNETGFGDFANTLASRPTYTALAVNPAFAQEWMKNRPKGKRNPLSKSALAAIKKVRFAALQAEPSEQAIILSGHATFREEIESVARQIWSVELDAPVAMPPQLVKNHTNGQQEILVSDVENNLYLVAPDGKIRWKKPLPGPILGKVHQVDLFKNQRLQYALVAKDQLVVLDRNGERVEPFPLTLKYKITSPLSVLDYDKNRNYRFFIGTEGGIFLFDREGKVVNGWNFQGNEPLADVVDFTMVNGKDYLLLHTTDGKVHFVMRNGKERPGSPIKTSVPAGFRWKLEGGKTMAYAFDTKGYQHTIFLNGQKDSLQILNSTRKVEVQEYQNQIILSDGNSVRILSKQNPLEASWPQDGCTGLKYLVFKGKLYVGATHADTRQIYLLNEKGQPVDGFPVFGAIPFTAGDLTGNGQLIFITGDGGKTLLGYNLE